EPDGRAGVAGRGGIRARRAHHDLAGSPGGPPAGPPLRGAARPQRSMSTAALVVAVALLVTGAVLFVAWPLASPDAGPPEQVLSDRDRRVLALRERRDAAYQALQDVEQRLHTGKNTPAAYGP